MARNSDYSFKIELDPKAMTVTVICREKDEKENWVEVDQRVYEVNKLPPDIRALSDCYGLSKIEQDRASGVSGPEKLVEMDAVYEQLCANKWERERRGGTPTVSAEVEALAQMKGCSVADIQKSLSKYTKEQKEKILGHDSVTQLAATIRESRSDEGPDLSDLA